MIRKRNGQSYEYVTVDLNTQGDFCDPKGACPVANLDGFIPALRRVIAWTKRNRVPIVSALHSHRLCEQTEADRPRHCVDGSAGQRKIPYTVFPSCAQVEADNTLSVPLDLFDRHQQVLFRMRTDDLLCNPKADRFLTQIPAEMIVVFGNTVEGAIKVLVLGLLAREKQVSVIVDACGYWNAGVADLTFRQLAAKGAHLITMDDLFAQKLTRRRRFARTDDSAGRLGDGRYNGTATAQDRPHSRESDGLPINTLKARMFGVRRRNSSEKPRA